MEFRRTFVEVRDVATTLHPPSEEHHLCTSPLAFIPTGAHLLIPWQRTLHVFQVSGDMGNFKRVKYVKRI
jgi:hypothetical protein